MTFTSLGSSLGAVKRESLEAGGQLMGRLEQQLTHCDGWLESRCCLRGVVGGDGRAGDQLKATKSKKMVVGCNPACPKNLGGHVWRKFSAASHRMRGTEASALHNRPGAQIRVRGAYNSILPVSLSSADDITLELHRVELNARKSLFLENLEFR